MSFASVHHFLEGRYKKATKQNKKINRIKRKGTEGDGGGETDWEAGYEAGKTCQPLKDYHGAFLVFKTPRV